MRYLKGFRSVLSLIVVAVMIFSLGSFAYASENVVSEPVAEENNWSVLEDSLIEAYTNEEKGVGTVAFRYSDGTEVEEALKDKIENLYENGEIEEIQKLILAEQIEFSYTNERTVKTIDKGDLKVPYQEITVTRSETFYHLETDTSGKYTKEWTVVIEGTFTYENLENQILTADNPSISIGTASFGSAFVPYMGNVVTYTPSINGSSVYFSAKHTMYADLYLYNVKVGTYNFGTHTDGFTESP